MAAAEQAGVEIRRPLWIIATCGGAVFFTRAFYQAFVMARLVDTHVSRRSAPLPSARTVR